MRTKGHPIVSLWRQTFRGGLLAVTLVPALAWSATAAERVQVRFDRIEVDVTLPSGYCAIEESEPVGRVLYPRVRGVMASSLRAPSLFLYCNELSALRDGQTLSGILLGGVAIGLDGQGNFVHRPNLSPADYLTAVADFFEKSGSKKEIDRLNRNVERTFGRNHVLESGDITVISNDGWRLLYRLDETMQLPEKRIVRRVTISGRRLLDGYDIIYLVNDSLGSRDWDAVIDDVRAMTEQTEWETR